MFRRSLHIIKNHRYLCNTRVLKLHSSVSSVLYSKFDKDLPNPVFPTPVSKMYGPDTDILLDQLKKCNSSERLLELMNLHIDVMNSKHMEACLNQIMILLKENNTKEFKESLLENHIFKLFCTRLIKVIRFFDPQEVISAYKTLAALDVRSNTYVMQSVLKMIGGHLNNMSLQQLIFLSFLLHKQRHNNLVDGLRLAIPLVLQVQIDQQLDSDNLTDVVNCLQLACRSSLKPTVIQKIVDTINNKASVLSPEDAVTVIFSLLNVDTPIDGYNQLLNVTFETVSKNVEAITTKKLCTILRTCANQRFYNFKFFSAVADLICTQKWSLDLTYQAIKQFHFLNFTSQNLLDYFAEILCLEYKTFKEDSISPLNCIEYLTATSYHPAKVDEAARVLYSDENNKLKNLKKTAPHLHLKFISLLAMIGHFPPHLLSNLLADEPLYSIWSFARKLGKSDYFERSVLYLFWSLSLYDEACNFTIPPTVLKKAINTVYKKNLNAEYPLTKFIENGLGGSQFLQTGVYTEDGHVIDYVVAMRSGNYPVSLQHLKSEDKAMSVQHLLYIQDIILPEDAKIVAILLAHENDYFRDPEILKGWMDLKVKCLTKKNYAVVVVNYAVWKNLPDREKIPYLMREIKQVISDDLAQKTNYS